VPVPIAICVKATPPSPEPMSFATSAFPAFTIRLLISSISLSFPSLSKTLKVITL